MCVVSNSFVFPQKALVHQETSLFQCQHGTEAAFISYHIVGTHSRCIFLSEILIRQESVEGSLWFSCSQVVFFV